MHEGEGGKEGVTKLIRQHNSVFLQSEKFRRASKVTTRLASLTSEATGKGFKSRIYLLKSIVTAWGANEEVSLKGDDQGSRTSDESDCDDGNDDVGFGDEEGPQSELTHLLTEEQ